MTEYGSLRQSITISTTVTATTTGGNSLETVAVVVLAGGVAWFLAGGYHSVLGHVESLIMPSLDASGGAAAFAALQAPENAKDHDDDEKCSNPENKCSECGGEAQICMTGTDTGCE